MSVYQVKLPVFEGPFDLLYHLIEDQKINIYDIPIARIAAQYLDYIQLMEILDMEVASGFLVMAATLLEIKSKMLLPREKNEECHHDEDDFDDFAREEDARSELVEKLLEYKKFKMVAIELREMEKRASRIFTRNTDIPRQPEEILEINIGAIDLLNIYHSLVRRRISPPIHRVVLEKIGIIDRISEIRTMLKQFKGEVSFHQLAKKCVSRYDKVISFMAILEMGKTGELLFSQKGNFAPIILKQAKDQKIESLPEPEDEPDPFVDDPVLIAAVSD